MREERTTHTPKCLPNDDVTLSFFISDISHTPHTHFNNGGLEDEEEAKKHLQYTAE